MWEGRGCEKSLAHRRLAVVFFGDNMVDLMGVEANVKTQFV